MRNNFLDKKIKQKIPNTKISVVLGSYNRLNFLKLTIDTVRRELKNIANNIAGNIDSEIIVVDGGSCDGTINWLVEQKDIITIVQHNRGEWENKKIERKSWGFFMNLAFKAASGKYICMLSDDCLVVPNAIKNGYEFFEDIINSGKKVGAVAFFWRDWPIQKKYHIGYTLGEKLYVNHGMYLSSALKDVDYIDSETFFFYNGDGDLCLKLWHKGYECLSAPNSFIEHYPHANLGVIKSNHDNQELDNLRYFKKWENIFYDKKLHNIGKQEEKEFIDPNKTAELFNTVHEQVIKNNPNLLLKKNNKNKFFKKIIFMWQKIKIYIYFCFNK